MSEFRESVAGYVMLFIGVLAAFMLGALVLLATEGSR